MAENISARLGCARACCRSKLSVSAVSGALPAMRNAMMDAGAHTITWKEDGVLCADFVASKE